MTEVTGATADSQPQGFFHRLSGLYSSPTAAFRDIVRQPRPIWPLLALVLVTGLTCAVWVTKADMLQVLQEQVQMAGRPAPVLEPEQAQKLVLVLRLTWLAQYTVGPVVLTLIVAALYLFVFRFFLASETSFGQSLSVASWAFLVPGIVRNVLTLAVLVLKGDWSVMLPMAFKTSAAAFLDFAATPKTLYALADSFDLLTFWTIWLLSVGLGLASKRSTASAAPGVIGLWVIGVLLKVGLAALLS